MSLQDLYIALRGENILRYGYPDSDKLLQTHINYFRNLADKTKISLPDDFISLQNWHSNNFLKGPLSVDYVSYIKPGKPLSGDFVHAFEQEGNIYFVIADGATMMVPQKYIETFSSAISGICTYTSPSENNIAGKFIDKGETFFVADNLWSFALATYFGVDIPSNPTYSANILKFFGNEPSLSSMLNQSESEANFPLKIFMGFDILLGKLYQKLFGIEISEENSPYFPSGIMVIGEITQNGRVRIAYRGDIRIGHHKLLREDSFSTKMSSKLISKDSVALEDVLADMLVRKSDMVEDVKVAELIEFHKIRRKDVGNIQGLGDIQPVLIEMVLQPGESIIFNTDGEDLRYKSQASNLHKLRGIVTGADLTSTLLYRNPTLYQMELIHNQRKWREAVKVPKYGQRLLEQTGNWRADDGSVLRIKFHPEMELFGSQR